MRRFVLLQQTKTGIEKAFVLPLTTWAKVSRVYINLYSCKIMPGYIIISTCMRYDLIGKAWLPVQYGSQAIAEKLSAGSPGQSGIFKMAATHCGLLRTIPRRIFMPAISIDNSLLLNNKQNTYLFICSRRFSTFESSKENEKLAEQPRVKRSQPRQFELTFEEYQKLRRKVRTTQRIAGLPVGALGLLTSSAVSAYLNPNMFDATPEQIQPIM